MLTGGIFRLITHDGAQDRRLIESAIFKDRFLIKEKYEKELKHRMIRCSRKLFILRSNL
jgi:hypothetical protein